MTCFLLFLVAPRAVLKCNPRFSLREGTNVEVHYQFFHTEEAAVLHLLSECEMGTFCFLRHSKSHSIKSTTHNCLSRVFIFSLFHKRIDWSILAPLQYNILLFLSHIFTNSKYLLLIHNLQNRIISWTPLTNAIAIVSFSLSSQPVAAADSTQISRSALPLTLQCSLSPLCLWNAANMSCGIREAMST